MCPKTRDKKDFVSPTGGKKHVPGKHRELRNAEITCYHVCSCVFTLSNYNETTTLLWVEF